MVRRTALTRRAALLVLAGAAIPAEWSAARPDRAVLIVGTASPVTGLDVIDIRRIFLGIPVTQGGVTLHALRNESDPTLQEVFLQNVVSMSTSAYQRRLLALVLEQGRQTPPAYTDLRQLLAVLATDAGAVSYAWESTVARHPRIRVLRVLWEG